MRGDAAALIVLSCTGATQEGMRTRRPALCGLLVAAAVALDACAALRLDARPQIRGTLVTTERSVVGIRHKTGATYQVRLTPDTRILDTRNASAVVLCPGLRATVYLVAPERFTASEVRVAGGRCQ
jgi:hypothetical protein